MPITNEQSIHIRPAEMADANAISAIHCSNIERWTRWEAGGPARPARYADLTPYERWQHGGAWLDPGTCHTHLQRLIRGGGFPLVAEIKGRVLGTAELHLADEPLPYGRNLNLSTLYVHRQHQRQGLGSALLRHSIELARNQACQNFIVAHSEAPDFYRKHGLKRAERWVQYKVPTARTRARYRVEPLADSAYELVRGQALLIGRYQNAHHDWERTRPNTLPDFPEWRGLKLDRGSIVGRRYHAAVILEESPQHPGVAETFLFSLTSELKPELFSAVRNLAHSLGFTHLHCLVRSDVKLPGAVTTDYKHQLFMKPLD